MSSSDENSQSSTKEDYNVHFKEIKQASISSDDKIVQKIHKAGITFHHVGATSVEPVNYPSSSDENNKSSVKEDYNVHFKEIKQESISSDDKITQKIHEADITSDHVGAFSAEPINYHNREDVVNNALENDTSEVEASLRIVHIPTPDLPFIISHSEEISFHADDNENNSSLSDDAHIIDSSAIVMDDEVVIDGVVIDLPVIEKKKTSKAIYFWFIFVAMLTISILIAFLGDSKNIPNNDSPSSIDTLEPSVSPTISSAPTSIYMDYVKQILIPISGEEALDDESSVQHFVWKTLAGSLPALLNASTLDLSDTLEITQRYLVSVTIGSTIGDLELAKSLLLMSQNTRRMCQIFICNDQQEVKVLFYSNRLILGEGKGIITSEIGHLTGLTDVILTHNGLNGTIPTEIGRLKNLRRLDLSNNLLSGRIPTEFGELESLELFMLGSNLLEGNIPTGIGNLSELFYMDLSDNKLTGPIPTEFDNLKNLEGIQIWNNTLSGTVDFLCVDNMTQDSFEIEIKAHALQTYRYSGELGMIVDCIADVSTLNCSCCYCHDESI